MKTAELSVIPLVSARCKATTCGGGWRHQKRNCFLSPHSLFGFVKIKQNKIKTTTVYVTHHHGFPLSRPGFLYILCFEILTILVCISITSTFYPTSLYSLGWMTKLTFFFSCFSFFFSFNKISPKCG